MSKIYVDEIAPKTAGGSITAPELALPSGSVLQVVMETDNHYVSGGTSSTTFIPSGCFVDITPRSSNSTFLIQFNTGVCYQDSGSTNFYHLFTVYRDGTTALHGSAGELTGHYVNGATYNDFGYSCAGQVKDSFVHDTATTYRYEIYHRTTAGNVFYDLEGQSAITVMEIAG